MTFDRKDLISGEKSRALRRRIRYDITDLGRPFSFRNGTSDAPNDKGKKESETDAKKRSRKCDDDFIRGGNWRKLTTIQLGIPFHRLHRRHLRKGNKATGRNRSQTVFHAIDRLFPDRIPKPDSKFFHDKPAPTRRQIVTDLVHDDHQVKQQDHFDADQKPVKEIKNIIHLRR